MRWSRRVAAIALAGAASALLGLTALYAPAPASSVAASPSPRPATAATAEPGAVIQGFEAPGPALAVTHDNPGFKRGKPYVGVKKVAFVPGRSGNAMRVDFSIIGGFRRNVMVKLNQGEPWNLSGQTQLSVTMKGDWADKRGARSVRLMMKMLNGSFWGVSFPVTRQWKTYVFPLDAAGTGWWSPGPNWGWKDDFTPDKVACITFFVSPPRTGDYRLWFDDLSVQGGPLQPYVDADAPVAEQFTSIPYAVGQAVDDMGRRDWNVRRRSVRNYQRPRRERPTLRDYQTVVDIGKAAGTRLTTAWILQDLDKHNVSAKAKYNTPRARYDMTIHGRRFRNRVGRAQRRAMNLVKGNAAYLEFGMHGVAHEHFRRGVARPAEYARIDRSKPGWAKTWGWRDMNLKAQCYREILRQWFTPAQLKFPVAAVPPAHAYYYRQTDPRTTGALLRKYGVKYVNGGMNVSTRITKGYLIDRGVLFINRAYGANRDWVGATPWEGHRNDFDKPYYPSDNYAWSEAHFPNLWGAKGKWVECLIGMNDSQRRFLARNSAQASWQYLYHEGGAISKAGDTYTIDLTGMDRAAYRWDLLGPMVLKTWVGEREISSVSLTGGATVLGSWKDTFGYAYLELGVNGNPQGRLDPAVYEMTVTFGDEPMASFVDLAGATYNVTSFSAGAHSASLKLQMYGRQTVKVKLPFVPASVESDHPGLEIRSWKYEGGYLVMDVRGERLTGEEGVITVADTPSVQPAYSDVDDFLYQLQNFDFVKAGNSRFDLVITDYSKDGREATRFSPAQIEGLKHSPGGPKRVLAYMSIGEAETCRWYWRKAWDANRDGVPDKGAPSWLGRSNPDWPDNYKVRFWSPGWQKLIYGTPESYLDKIIADGYDGVYLDIIDAYEYWGPGGKGRPTRATAEQDMVDFVRAIADYARVVKGRPDFAVFPQNGSDLGKHPEYLAVVTGLGKEDTWYDGDRVSPWSKGDIRSISRFRDAGKLVLCTDYCRRRAHIDRFYRLARAGGFVPYATVRDLDRLVVNPGHAPD